MFYGNFVVIARFKYLDKMQEVNTRSDYKRKWRLDATLSASSRCRDLPSDGEKRSEPAFCGAMATIIDLIDDHIARWCKSAS